MRVRSSAFVLFGLFSTISTTFLAAHGYDSLVRHDLGAPADLAPFATATTADNGLWLLAPATGDEHQLVRLDANGNRTAGLFLPTAVDSDNSDRFTLYPLADGGVLELDTHRLSQFFRVCILRSVTREGQLRFVRNVRQASCDLKVGKLGRAPYLLSNIEGATLISEDGSLASSFVPEDDPNSSIVDSALIRAEFIAERELLLLRANQARTGYVLSRANQDGTQQWSTFLETVRFEQNVTVRGLSDGRALVLIADTSKLQMRFYSAEGSLIETREIAMSESSQAEFGDWASDGLGNHALMLELPADSGTSRYGAILFTPNGNVLKQIRYAATDQCRQICPILGLAQGFAKALRTQTGGKLVLTSLLPDVANVEIELAGAFNARIATGSSNTILMTSDESFRVFTNSGNEITAPSMRAKGTSLPNFLVSTITDDGKSFVLQRTYDAQIQSQLQAFSANGTKLWQRKLAIEDYPQMVADGARICLRGADSMTLSCYSNATGVPVGSLNMPTLNILGMRMRFLSDGRLRIVAVQANGVKIVDLANDNEVTELNVSTGKVEAIADIGASGSVLLAVTVPAAVPGSNTASEWLALDAFGRTLFRRPFSSGGFDYQSIGRMLENDDALFISPIRTPVATDEFETALLNRNGMQRWVVSNQGLSPDDFSTYVAIDSKNAYVTRRVASVSAGNLASRALRIQALSLIDGASQWTQTLKSTQYSDAFVYAAPNPSQILVAITSDLGVQLNKLSSLNGSILEQRLLDCAAAKCHLYSWALDRAGEFRTISDLQNSSESAITLGRADTRVSTPEIGIDQTGLSGAWYTPQVSGQGFFLEYFSQNKLLFSPWFTYSGLYPDDNEEPLTSDAISNLRWYTLSGIVEPGAKVAQLEIRRNIAGVFNSAPITESTVVGTATLRAQDCNRATLEFEFISSEAQGKYGVLPLDRLTGGSAPCQLSNGQTQPGRDARPARGGFDGRQSGSWFQPQTAGQGLMMTVQPATASAPGFFFGGWFTYDAGVPNDPTSQHWLTLSGEIPVNAQTGVVPVTIYRTLGGQLAAVPTQNNTILGQATVTFSGCANAVLRYQFDDTLIAGTFRARAGEINLQRLGACPAQ